MAVLFQNTAEGGTDQATVTAANSGGASGDAFSGVTIGAGGAYIFDSAQVGHGALSYKASNGATAVAAYGVAPLSAATGVLRGRLYLRMSVLPPSVERICGMWSGTILLCQLAVRATGQLTYAFGSTGDVAGASANASSASIPINTWARVEFDVTFDGTATAAGTMVARWFLGDSTVQQGTDASFTGQTGTASSCTLARIGQISGTGANSDFWFDDIRLQSDPLPIGPPGPPPTPATAPAGVFAPALVPKAWF